MMKPTLTMTMVGLIALTYIAWFLVHSVDRPVNAPKGQILEGPHDEKPHSAKKLQDSSTARRIMEPDAPMSAAPIHTQEDPSSPRPKLRLRGRVVYAQSHSPVEAFTISAEPRGYSHRSVPHTSRVVQDAGGCFELALQGPGRYAIAVWTDHTLPWTQTIHLSDALCEWTIEIEEGLALNGRVVDAQTAQPIEGAIVAPAAGDSGTLFPEVQMGSALSFPHAVTAADGSFVLKGLSDRYQRVAAGHPEYVQASIEWDPTEEDSIEFKLGTGLRVSGRTFDDEGAPLQGVNICMNGLGLPLPWTVQSDHDGRFSFPPTVAGTVRLDATSARRSFADECAVLQLDDRDLVYDFGPSDSHVHWKGKVLGEMDSSPITLILDRVFNPLEGGYHLRRVASADDLGAFEFPKLPPGRYALTLTMGTTSLSRWREIEFTRPGPTTRDLETQGASIRGRAELADSEGKSRGLVRLRREGERRVLGTTDLRANRRFAFVGLEPGRYELTFKIPGKPQARSMVSLEAGQEIDNHIVPIREGGHLSITLEGFEGVGFRDFMLVLESEGQPTQRTAGYIDDEGSWADRYLLCPGEWTAHLDIQGLASLTEKLHIQEGQKTAWILDHSQLPAAR